MHLKKHRGQHLLTDKNLIFRIIREAEISNDDRVIEIGSGTGLLTEALARNAGEVLTFEIDPDFKGNLVQLEDKYDNLRVVMDDFLDFPLEEFLEKRKTTWRIIGNIPYNITTPIIEKIIGEMTENIRDVHLMIQKEVARRISALPGGKDYGRLTVFVKFFFEPEILFTVGPDVFVPPPSVDSAFLRLNVKDTLPDADLSICLNTVRAAFAHRRKQIFNSIRKSGLINLDKSKLRKALRESGIDGARRAETLSLEEFIRLAKAINRQANVA